MSCEMFKLWLAPLSSLWEDAITKTSASIRLVCPVTKIWVSDVSFGPHSCKVRLSVINQLMCPNLKLCRSGSYCGYIVSIGRLGQLIDTIFVIHGKNQNCDSVYKVSNERITSESQCRLSCYGMDCVDCELSLVLFIYLHKINAPIFNTKFIITRLMYHCVCVKK